MGRAVRDQMAVKLAKQHSQATYSCIHFHLDNFGFGSEINNLISAAMYAESVGLKLIVEDDQWNSGRFHDYFSADELCGRKKKHRPWYCSKPLVVQRHKYLLDPGWVI